MTAPAAAWSMALACGATASIWIYEGRVHLSAPKQMSAVDATRLGMGLAEAARRLAQQPPKRTARPRTPVSAYSELACKRCEAKHLLNEHSTGQRVTAPNGLAATVIDWTQYGCPLTVNVRYENGTGDSFDPCQLRGVP
jgi:hypothetical protein